MDPVAALGAASTVISVAFFACVMDRWVRRHKPHEAAWAQSMAMFALASGAYWWGAGVGWNGPSFRLFYLFGAILNVAYLAAGTVWLLAAPAVGRRVHSTLHAIAFFCAGLMIASPTKAPIPTDGLPIGKEVFGIGPRILAAVGSGIGATVLIVGAVVSCIRLFRAQRQTLDAAQRSTLRRLAATNALIAIGSLVLGVGGAGFTGADAMTAFGIFLTAGITILFAGFLVSSPRTEPDRPSTLPPFFEELRTIAEAGSAQAG